MAAIRQSRIGLVIPTIAYAKISLCSGEANAHVNEEHVVEQPPTVMVIDDDPGVRDSLGRLLRSAGFQVSLFGSVSEFLEADLPEGPTCLVLDVRLPGQSGLELQRELASAKKNLPQLFL